MKVHGAKHSVIIVVFLSLQHLVCRYNFGVIHIAEIVPTQQKDDENMADTQQHFPRTAARKSKTAHRMQMSPTFIYILHRHNCYEST